MKPVTAEPKENRGFRLGKAISRMVNKGDKRDVIFVLFFLFEVIYTSKWVGFAGRESVPEFHSNQTAFKHSTKVRPCRQEGAFGSGFL